jgi:hypothetical protein
MQGQNLNINQLFQSLLGGTSATNPSSSPLDISSANLVGLTPEHISSALQMKMMQDETGQNALMDRVKMMQAFQGIMTPEDIRTADMKNYEYAKQQGYQGSFDDFVNQQAKGTAGIRDYEYAVQQGYTGSYEQWKTDLAKLGGTNINLSPYDQTSQRERAKQQTSVMAPDFVPKLRKEVSESIDARSITDMKEREGFINQKVKDLLKEQVLSAYPDAFEGTHPTNSSIKGWWTKTDDGKWMLIQRTPGE